MSQAPIKRQTKCPICGKASLAAFGPFCSARCANVDLGRWLGEEYRVPGDDARPSAGVGIVGDADDE